MFVNVDEVDMPGHPAPTFEVTILNGITGKLFATVTNDATRLALVDFMSGEVAQIVIDNYSIIELASFIKEKGYANGPKVEVEESSGTVITLTSAQSNSE